MNRTAGGLSFLELISTLAIVSILISFAMPRFLMVRKQAFKPEARSLLQEAKTLEWAYYQEHNMFETTPGRRASTLRCRPARTGMRRKWQPMGWCRSRLR